MARVEQNGLKVTESFKVIWRFSITKVKLLKFSFGPLHFFIHYWKETNSFFPAFKGIVLWSDEQ